MAKTQRGADQAMIRLPDGMRDRIKAAAEANNRSMNAEIVATLEEKYPPPLIGKELFEAVFYYVDRRKFGTLPEEEWDRLPKSMQRLVRLSEAILLTADMAEETDAALQQARLDGMTSAMSPGDEQNPYSKGKKRERKVWQEQYDETKNMIRIMQDLRGYSEPASSENSDNQ